MKHFQLVGLATLALIFLSAPLAAQSSPRADFMAGVAAFEQGDLENAKRLMEQARGSGFSSSSLLYNLGVVYFRLGLTDEAEAAFTGLLDTPHAPLARYNLGLVSQKKGDTEGARRWFRQAASDSSPEKIQTLARRQLNRSSENDLVAAPPFEMLGYLSVGAGYDDNVSGTPSTESTGESGSFGEVLMSGRALLNRSAGNAIRFEALAYRRQYPGKAQFTDTYASTGIGWQSAMGQGQLLSALNLSGLWFGSDLVERQTSVEFTYSRENCPATLRCQFVGFASSIQAGSDFSAYDGRLYGASASVEKNVSGWTVEAAYRLEVNQRDDLQLGDEFFSVSPTRHKLSIALDYQLAKQWTLGLEQAAWFSRYDDPHRLLINGETVTETRDDEQFRTSFRSRYQVDRRWWLGMELIWMDNQSSIERYEYDRTEILFSLDVFF